MEKLLFYFGRKCYNSTLLFARVRIWDTRNGKSTRGSIVRYGFGVDVFGPLVKFGFFDETGNLLEKWKVTTPDSQDGNRILKEAAGEIEHFMSRRHLFEDDVIGVGIGIPGPVNQSGVVNKCVNYGWGVFNIERALSGFTGLNVKAGNIASLAALGECWKGSGTRNMAFVAMNTGLGGAVVCDGVLAYGAHGGGGEFGHMIVNKNEQTACTCGRKGCVEQYCSPVGIMREMKRRSAAARSLSILRRNTPADHLDVAKAAEAGDKIAAQVMDQCYDYFGQMLASVCCVTNPDTVVLGGELVKIGQPALKGITKAFRRYVFHANENVDFRLASLGTDACIHGAFKVVLDAFGR